MLNTQNVTLAISAGRPDQFLSDPIPQVALSGRSNVGKSSLINSLLGRKSLARVSGTPGKTITVNYYRVDGKLFLVDLPGYGYAKRTREEQAKWSALTDGYLVRNPNIDRLRLILQLIDVRVGPTADDNAMLGWLNSSDIPYAVVATKCDKCSKTELNSNIDALASHPNIAEGTPIVSFSSTKGMGQRELWGIIADATGVR